MQRRRTTGLTDYRSVMYSTGDISVGAYARVQRRRRILIGIGGLVLIGAAVSLHALLRPAASEISSTKRPVLMRCVTCGYEGVINVETAASDQPLKCPKCGTLAGRKVWECRDCGAQFLAIGRPEELRCERCGSRRVGTAEGPAAGPGGGPQE
jgi:DNA-directed RNA polymerase subunit RPC12/RpoP